MQILDSMSQFFSSFKQPDTNSFEAVSESSTKIQFKDYLHDAMDEAGNKNSISFQKVEGIHSDTKILIETAASPILEANFASLQTPILNETNFLFSKSETDSESALDFKDEEALSKPEKVAAEVNSAKLEIVEEEIQEIKPTEFEQLTLTDEDDLSDAKMIAIETLPQEKTQPELEVEVESKENIDSIKFVDQKPMIGNSDRIVTNAKSIPEKDMQVEESVISKTAIEEKSQTVISPEIKKEISKPIQEKQNSESLLKELILSSNNTKLESKPERTLELKEILSEKPELKSQNLDIVKKDKKENIKMNIVSSSSESKDAKQTDLINQSKEKNHSKDSSEELLSLDKTKWTISRKESSNFDSRKENNSNPSTTLSTFQKLDSDKLKIDLPISKFEVEFKSIEKAKELKPEKEIYQKSLNELVQKARMNIVEGGKNSAQISLQPGDLGKMTLNIEVVRDRVEGKIFVDSESIKTILLNDLLSLKEDFKSSGLSLDSLSVEVKSENHSASQYTDFDENKKFAESQRNIFGINKESILKVEEFSSPVEKLLDVRV